MQMFLLCASSLPNSKGRGRSSLPASTPEPFASHSWRFWGALFPWPPIIRHHFPKLVSRDVAAGYQHKPFHQIAISAEAAVGCDRKRQKLLRNISAPLLPWTVRSKRTFPKRAAWASASGFPLCPEKQRNSRSWKQISYWVGTSKSSQGVSMQ